MDFIVVNEENAEQESLFCIKNPKNPGFKLKLQWLKENMKNGLKLVLLKERGELAGFIEYSPGENAWRPVNAGGYLFIHCIWVYPKKNHNRGFGSALINYCIDDAKKQGMNGVAVMVSKGSWMAGAELFTKNGFEVVEVKERFELLVIKNGKTASPSFRNWEENLKHYKGLHLLYANQCPLFIKSVDEMKKTATEMGFELKVSVMDHYRKAQNAPSGYGVYNLVYNGKLLSDHYISNTRFKNILTHEL